MRRAARTDRNHAEIVAALRQIGCKVQDLSRVGGGVPDLMVCRLGRIVLLEIKDGTKPPSARALTAEQERWHDEWAGAPVAVVNSVDEAMRAVIGPTWSELIDAF